MKRKYPLSFFIYGVFLNAIQNFIIALIGLIFIVIGLFGVYVCKVIGTVVLLSYLPYCIIKQIYIRHMSLKERDDPGFNEFMDKAFGVENNDEYGKSPEERIRNIVYEKIKSQDDNKNK